MQINYFGHSYLLIIGKDYSIALDPYGDIGLIPPKVSCDYVFSSHSHYDHNNFSVVDSKKTITNSNNLFKIIPSFHDNSNGKLRGINNVLLFSLDGYSLAFMGDYGEDYNENVINELLNVDILFIPIGGKYTIDYKVAKKYCDEIKPKTIIPIHYKIKGSNIDIDGLDNFLKLFKDYTLTKSPYNYNDKNGVVVVSPDVKEMLWNILVKGLKIQQGLKN